MSKTIALGGGESILLQDALDPQSFPGEQPSSWTGQLRIDSSVAIKAWAHIYTTSSEAGTYGSVFESYDPFIMPEHGTITGLLHNLHFRSNVALANGSNGTNVLQLSFRNANGVIIGTGSVTLQPNQTKQLSVATFVNAPEDAFSLRWTSTRPAIAVASIVDNRSGDPSNAPSIANARTNLFFPIAGKTQGAADTNWVSSLSLTSDAEIQTVATVRFHGVDNLTTERTITIPPMGTTYISDLMVFLERGSTIGFLEVDASSPIVSTLRIFTLTSSGATYGSLLLPQEPGAESSLLKIRGVRVTSRFRANVALTNRGQLQSAGTIRMFDDRGQLIEKWIFSVRPHDTIQVPILLPALQIEAGEVEVTTPDQAPLFVIISNVDNESGDTVVREVEQELERQQ